MAEAAVQHVQIRKMSGDDQRKVWGVVYAPASVDTHGEIMLAEDVALMAERFMRLDLSRVIDVQHDNAPIDAFPFESFIARDGDPDFPAGAWVIGVKIEDPAIWAMVKTGEINGFSFQAWVTAKETVVEYEIVFNSVGRTEDNSGHDHAYWVEFDESGRVKGGRTSVAADGHWHRIAHESATDDADGHAHRWFV